jgi:hypothetical protein
MAFEYFLIFYLLPQQVLLIKYMVFAKSSTNATFIALYQSINKSKSFPLF